MALINTLFSVISPVIRSRRRSSYSLLSLLMSNSGGAAAPPFGTVDAYNINIPTSRPPSSSTPHSFVQRCALSTNCNNHTSGFDSSTPDDDGSSYSKKAKKARKMDIQVVGNDFSDDSTTHNAPAPVCALEPFKFKGVKQLNCGDNLFVFPRYSLGNYVLDRRRVVDIVVDEVSRQEVFHEADSRSVYLCGCRAMETNMVRRIQQLLKDETNTIVILVDGVESDVGHGQLKELLKMSNPRLITIGAAVPLSSETANTGNFRYKIQTSDLVLKRTDTDYTEFVRAISESVVKKAHPITSYQVCSDICDFVLTYCGGHVYPTLNLISYFFTMLSFEHLQSVAVFQHYLFSQEFENNRRFADIKNRCFDHDTNYDGSIDRLMRGIALEGDMAIWAKLVDRWSWWNKDTNDLISTMLRNYWLTFYSKKFSQRIALISGKDCKSNFSNTIVMLTEWLDKLDASDFRWTDRRAMVPIEKALSSSWMRSVLMKYSNVYIKAQITTLHSGYADYYVNGACSCIVGFILNATQVTCDEHLNRFLSGKYPWEKNFIIVNLAMTKSSEIVLPTDPRYNNIVLTYVHSENTLYCGSTAIISPAVSSLASATSISIPLSVGEFIRPE